MKNTLKERQALVEAIEAGRYKSGSQAEKTALIAILIVFSFVFFMTLLAGGVAGGMAGGAAGGGIGLVGAMMLALTMFFPVGIVAVVLYANRAADLGKLTPLDRWLILYGEKVEADLDSIEQRGNRYIFHCNAEYAGRQWQYNSPAIGVQPIPFEKKKVDVYVNPDNPSQYIIDIYNHLPLAGDSVLHDRSEVKVAPNTKNPNQGSNMAALAIICVVFIVPFGLFGLLAGCGAIASGEIGFGLFAMTAMPVISILAIVGIFSAVKKNKDVAEKGYYIPATATRYWVTRSKNSTTYHLSARYIEPSTKIVHDFQTSGSPKMKVLVGSKVDVFINPENTREYYIDIPGSMKKLGFTTSREK